MIKEVASVALPVDEVLSIKKRRIQPSGKTKGLKRISIVTGIHGDELEGQYVCYELGRRIEEQFECLKGIVDIYPAMNPLGIDSITRGIPAFDLDMNRLFPGNSEGNMTEYLASEIMKDVSGSNLVVDIHASNIYLTEIPQIRINELHEDFLVPIAKKSNVDFIWVHGASTVLESTFAHSLNSTGTPCLVVEMGVGMRITKAYGDQMVDGIFSLMKELGIWKGEVKAPVIKGNAYQWSTAGFFGRLNYDYKGKYLFEANLRYDGTSRFRADSRWTLAPSFSAGWNIAQEDWWDGMRSKVNLLKLRYSYGQLGNQQVGYYDYIRSVSMGKQSYLFFERSTNLSGRVLGRWFVERKNATLEKR